MTEPTTGTGLTKEQFGLLAGPIVEPGYGFKPVRALVLHEDGTTTHLWLHGAYEQRLAQLEEHAGHRLHPVEAIEATYWVADAPMTNDFKYNARVSEISDYPVYGPVALTGDSTLLVDLPLELLPPVLSPPQTGVGL